MLEVFGTVKGRLFPTPTPITAKELAEMFNLPVPKAGVNILEMKKELVSYRGGEKRVPPSLNVPPEFSVTSPDGESSFTLRYYRSKSPLPGAPGSFAYSPKIIRIGGETPGFEPKAYEQYVFWALSPYCSASPEPGKRVMYNLLDPAKKAAEAEMAAKTVQDMIRAITNSPDDRVIAKSIGMVVNGYGTGVGANVLAATHRVKLMELLMKFPLNFAAEWAKEESTIKGVVALGVDRGKIVQSMDGGRPCWRLAADNRILLFFDSAQDPFRALTDWANVPDNTSAIMAAMSTSFNLAEAEPELPAEIKHMDPVVSAPADPIVDAVNAGIENGDIFYSKTEKVVYLTAETDISSAVFEPTDPKKWKSEFVEFLKTKAGESVFADLSRLITQ